MNAVERHKDKIRKKQRIEKVTAGPITAPFVSSREAAARLGIDVETLYRWIARGVIPRPRKYNTASKRPFRREYVEILRDCIIIRNSSVGYKTLEDFRKLCLKRLWGHH